MSKARSMYAGSSGSNYGVNKNSPGNGNGKWQGLWPSVGHARNSRYINTRAGGDNRNVVFCMNQLGGVGRISNMFATTADGADCVNNQVVKYSTIYKPPGSRLGDCDCTPAVFELACLNSNACGNLRCAFNLAFNAAFVGANATGDAEAALAAFFAGAECNEVLNLVLTPIVDGIEAAAPGLSSMQLCGFSGLQELITVAICAILTELKGKSSDGASFSAAVFATLISGNMFDEISNYLAKGIECGDFSDCPWE